VIREECERMCRIEKNMLRWFGHVERMDERRLTKEIYEAGAGGNAGRGRPNWGSFREGPGQEYPKHS
jgi:hypothetical protein